MIGAHLVISAQASGFEEPRESSFDNPALALNMKPFSAVRRLHDVQTELAPRSQGFDPGDQTALVSSVCPNDLQPSEGADQYRQEALGSHTILHACLTDPYAQQQAQRVHRQMALAALDLLARIVAAGTTLLGRLNRLAVNNSRSRRRPAPTRLAQAIPEPIVDKLPGPVLAPLAKIAIDRTPGKSLGNSRHAQPERTMYRMALRSWRRSNLGGRPRLPGFALGAGTKPLIPFHSWSVRSVGYGCVCIRPIYDAGLMLYNISTLLMIGHYPFSKHALRTEEPEDGHGPSALGAHGKLEWRIGPTS